MEPNKQETQQQQQQHLSAKHQVCFTGLRGSIPRSCMCARAVITEMQRGLCGQDSTGLNGRCKRRCDPAGVSHSDAFHHPDSQTAVQAVLCRPERAVSAACILCSMHSWHRMAFHIPDTTRAVQPVVWRPERARFLCMVTLVPPRYDESCAASILEA